MTSTMAVHPAGPMFNVTLGKFPSMTLLISSNETEDDDGDAFNLWEHHLKPHPNEWFVFSLFIAVFLVAITGNMLIFIYILRREKLQTTVNYFMLNLALADLLVTLIALPPTLMVDLLETWLLGKVLCKLTPYLQMTVVSVSSLTLGAIALNRYYVVCRPLKVIKVRTSPRRAFAYMLGIWIFSLLTLCPVAVVTGLEQDFPGVVELELLHSCQENWPSHGSEAAFHLYYISICYLLPLAVLGVTYVRVFQELRNAKMPGYYENKHKNRSASHRECGCKNGKRSTDDNSSLYSPLSPRASMPSSPLQVEGSWRYSSGRTSPAAVVNHNGDANRENKRLIEETHSEETHKETAFIKRLGRNFSLRSRKSTSHNCCRKCSAQIMLHNSRRRSAIMQVTLIVVFGLCYAPVMTLDVVRRIFHSLEEVHRETLYVVSSIAHLIMYFNSAINPIIYNFFSVQFRKEFRKTFSCCFENKLQRSTSILTASFFLPRSENRTRAGTSCNEDERIADS